MFKDQMTIDWFFGRGISASPHAGLQRQPFLALCLTLSFTPDSLRLSVFLLPESDPPDGRPNHLVRPPPLPLSLYLCEVLSIDTAAGFDYDVCSALLSR